MEQARVDYGATQTLIVNEGIRLWLDKQKGSSGKQVKTEPLGIISADLPENERPHAQLAELLNSPKERLGAMNVMDALYDAAANRGNIKGRLRKHA